MRRTGWRVGSGLCAVLGAVIVLGAAQAAEIASEFQPVWERTDRPVREGQVPRTWMWGPEGNSGPLLEPYSDAPGGERVVQYFDKSRMEITDPDADPRDPWYVTNGLLARELITGRMQVGDDAFRSREPAHVQVAGDAHSDTPTYASFSTVIDRSAQAVGSVLRETIDKSGSVGSSDEYADYGVTAEHHVDQTGQTVASVFWAFMNATGEVFVEGELRTGSLFPNPFYGIGLPITGAYWMKVPVGGEWQDVLAQCFERRCLTYTPANPDGWRVEAGNIGQHYYEWRYGDSADGQSPDGDDLGPPVPGHCDASAQAVLQQVSDSLGNVNPNSWATGTGGDWPGGADSAPEVQPEASLQFEISATGECNPLEYRVQRYVPGSGVDVIRRWSADAGFSYRFPEVDAGAQVMLIIDVRDTDPRTRFDGRDDYTYLTYRVEQ